MLHNKFIVYCATFAELMIYHACGGIQPVMEKATVDDRDFSKLLPGDQVSVRQYWRGEDGKEHYNGHDFIYLSDAGDDDPYTMIIAQSPGDEDEVTGKKLAIAVNFKDWNKEKSVDRQ